MERIDNENSMVEEPPTNLKSSCLLCGSSSLTVFKIFTDEGLFSDLGNKINLYLPVEVKPGDGLPEQCCSKCTSILMSWHNLYLTCLKKQKLYQKILVNSALEQPEVLIKPDVVTEKQLNLRESMRQAKEEPQSNECSEDDEEAFLMKFEEENQDGLMGTLKDSTNEGFEEQDKMPCSICKAVFEKKSMQLHLMTDHSEELHFLCDICGKAFRFESQLDNHLPLHSNSRPFKCKICLKAFKWKASVRLHQNVHLDKNAFECKLCNTRIAHRSSWLWHLRQKHKMTLQQYDALPPETARQMNLTAAALRDSKRANALTCKICNKTLSTRRALNAHIKVIHENIEAREKVPCTICGFLAEKSHMKQHLTKHSDERPFSCESCGKAFKLKKHLTQHMLTHSKKT